ncbi:haloacid dehalogenase, partial [Tothia fuscella]
MAASKEQILAFDLYGTLLSTESIATKLGKYSQQDQAKDIAAKWRWYQLEYTWRLNSMEHYEPFNTVTLKALNHALAEAGVSLNPHEKDTLMSAYDDLSTFPDVSPALKTISQTPNLHCVIFSNGTHSMVTSSLTKSASLSPHKDIFRDIVVVESIKKYKPARDVYWHLLERLGKERSEAGEVWLVTANPFDVVGAVGCGLKACWVDRTGAGWVDRLGDGEKGKPTVIVKSLEEVVDIVK